MKKIYSPILIVVMILAMLPAASVQAQAPVPPAYLCLPQVVPISVDTFRTDLYCVPTAFWNGDMLVYAHGYVSPTEPVGTIPQDQLSLGDIDLIGMVTQMGYAFVTTSYSKNGLAVLQGLADVVYVANAFKAGFPTVFAGIQQAYGWTPPYPLPAAVRYSYLAGPSEGGAITALAMEMPAPLNPFDGGYAVCGPIGSFQRQINYWGDFRVVFDYYFKDTDGTPLIPNPGLEGWPGYAPTDLVVPQEVIDNWPAYEAAALAALTNPANAAKVKRLAAVTRLPYDPGDPMPTIVASAMSVLWYDVFATNDGAATLGGQPFDNMGKWYAGTGSLSGDFTLNKKVQRVEQTMPAGALVPYETTGRLVKPMITMHTLYDPEVPYWHEVLYLGKLRARGTSLRMYGHIPTTSYGHCNFTSGQILAGFAWMVYKTTGALPGGGLSALPAASDRVQYQRILKQKTNRVPVD